MNTTLKHVRETADRLGLDLTVRLYYQLMREASNEAQHSSEWRQGAGSKVRQALARHAAAVRLVAERHRVSRKMADGIAFEMAHPELAGRPVFG